MRISNVEWLKKRIGFIRKLGEKTARQRQIIDRLDDEGSLSETDRRQLHVLATAEKNALQEQDAAQKKAVQVRISGRDADLLNLYSMVFGCNTWQRLMWSALSAIKQAESDATVILHQEYSATPVSSA